MRSLKLFSAALPLHFLAASAYRGDADTTVIETITRTVTVCPIQDLFQCGEEAEPTRPLMDWIDPTNTPKPTSATTTRTGTKTTTRGGDGTTTTRSGTTTISSTTSRTSTVTYPDGETTTTTRDNEGTTTTTRDHEGTTTTTRDNEGTTTTRDNEGTTTTTRDSEGTTTTTHYEHDTTTSTGTTMTTSSHYGGETTSTTTETSYGPETTTAQETTTTGTDTTTERETTTTGTETTTTGTETTTTGTASSTSSTSTTTGTGSSTTSTSTGTESTTTTSGTTSSTSTTTSTTSHAACPTGEPGYHCPDTKDECNEPGKRGSWCDNKSINDDNHIPYESGEEKHFKLVLTKGTVNADGAGARQVFLINGKTPGEAIEVNWGDWVTIDVENQIPDNVTSIHWHGVRQAGTNDQDGVPGVTECGIAPGSTRTYRWLASSYGTGWYHSHALAQYGGGIRGPLIIHGPATADYDFDQGPIMIDEKLDRPVFELAYTIARTQGQLPPASNVLFNGGNKSPDNTLGVAQKWVVQKDKKYLFRFINSAAQSAYAVRFDNHKMTVISADFVSIKPYETEWLYLSAGQRYNVIVKADQAAGAYYLRAVTQTGCGGRCVNDGKGNANAVIEYDTSLGATPFSNGTVTLNVQTDCKDEPIASLVPYVSKSAGTTGDFTAKVKLLAGGNAAFEQFGAPTGQAIRWYLGPPTDISSNSNTTRSNKAINVTFEQPTLKTFATVQNLDYNSPIFSSAAVLDTAPNAWVYFVIQNNFQTAHPMHLHGHDFSVLGQGKGVFNVDTHLGALNFANPIRRDTANLFGMPVPNTTPPQYVSGWTVIGFETDNPGAWVMHCHIMWHADGGMGLQYLERPGEIKATEYYGEEFKKQCSAVEAYHAAGGAQKAPYEAGLKRHLAQHAHAAHGQFIRDAPSW